MSFLDIDCLKKGLAELQLDATQEQVEKLDRFAEMLFKWNKTYNLTAIRSKDEVLTHHILDSLAVIPLFKQQLKEGAKVLDVGSGGGLPAIPLAIMCPFYDVTMVDTVGKKAAFLTQCCVSLRLSNARAMHSRVEKINSAQFDVITSRAFASLKLFADLTKHLFNENGFWLALKGPGVSNEILELDNDVHVQEIFEVEVPFLKETRCLVKMERRLDAI